MNDTIRNGIRAGLLGGVGDTLIHIPAYFILGTTTTAHYISQLIFPLQPVTFTRLSFGFAIHFFAGAFLGVVLALIFKYFGKDYAFYKGVGLGVMMWIVHVAIIPNLVAPRPYLHRTELEALVDFVAHIVYGIVATVYFLKHSRSVRQ